MHKATSDSKGSDGRMEASLRRIESRLGTLPESAHAGEDRGKLPHTPMEMESRPAR